VELAAVRGVTWRAVGYAAWLLVLGASPHVRADANRHTFWEVKGHTNTVYLLGSVHMLKPDDSALPAEVLEAYQSSKSLVMELDLNGVDSEALLGTGIESAMLPEGQSLSEVLGAELYADLVEHAKKLGLEPEIMDRFQPWFAALLMEQTALSQAGMEAGAGVDEQFAQRARDDDKPIIALETAEEQLGFFAHLSMNQQRQYLRATLKDLNTEGTDAAAMVRAWQNGDTAELEHLMRKDSASNPELFHLLTTERNRKWLPKIAALLREDQNYLVIVGALHLVGDDGLVELLRRQGFQVVQH
jgi:uncharacterized protein YbaP (TraB family)